jgi:hypothetical protein
LTSFVLELLVYPVLFVIWKGRARSAGLAARD